MICSPVITRAVARQGADPLNVTAYSGFVTAHSGLAHLA
jgi:short subunit fatty acids transporter